MKIYKEIGSKERLKEIFEKINKVKIVEQTPIKKVIKEEYNKWGLKQKPSRINESFDSPVEKDKEYLDKLGNDNGQDDKYDDGVRYPVEKNLQVNNPALQGLKGDNAPLKEDGEEGESEETKKFQDAQRMRDMLKSQYGVEDASQLSPEQYKQLMKSYGKQQVAPMERPFVSDKDREEFIARDDEIMNFLNDHIKSINNFNDFKMLANLYKQQTGINMFHPMAVLGMIQRIPRNSEQRRRFGKLEDILTNMTDNPEKVKMESGKYQPVGEEEDLDFDVKKDGDDLEVSAGDEENFDDGTNDVDDTEKPTDIETKSGIGSEESPDVEKAEDNYHDEIPGGLGDEDTPDEYDPEQISKGIKVEMEHTNDPKIALEIALDHLHEDPQYYGTGDEDPEEMAKLGAQKDANDTEEKGEEGEDNEDNDLEKNILWGNENTFGEALDFKYKPRNLTEGIGNLKTIGE